MSDERDEPRGSRQASTSPITVDIKLTKSPGPWVDVEKCHGCGQLYSAFRSSANFARSCAELRAAAKGLGDASGGTRRRNSVLFHMRATKLDEWWMEHVYCKPEAAMPAEPPPIDGAGPVLTV